MQGAVRQGLAVGVYGAVGGGHWTIRVSVVVRVSPPPLPVMVTEYVPGDVDAPTESAMVEDPEPGAAIDDGLNAAVAPLGSPDALKEIAELNPPVVEAVIALFPWAFGAIGSEAGEVAIVNVAE